MSKIEVDAITEQSGSTLTAGGGAGKTVVVDATTVTLGRCGGTVALASGASQTGFGRTGTVDWQTTPKTATFTAANGEGYFCNTAGGTFEVDLPAGSAGAIVSVQDYNNTFDSHSLTVDPDGTEKINGGDAGEPVTLDTEGRGVTFVYIDATVGWRSVQDNDFTKKGESAAFICASVSGTGSLATAPDCANVKIATFTGPGTFTVNSAGNAAGSNSVDYMIVAGGGGGGIGYSSGYCGGGGGAGGYRESPGTVSNYTASPLGASPATAITVTAQGYTIEVGGGGPGKVGCSGNGNGPNVAAGANGIASSALGITSAGGGGGAGGGRDAKSVAGNGGSGGGGAYSNASPAGGGGTGNTPSTNPSQGTDGGTGGPGSQNSGGGGGGATAVGGNRSSPSIGGTGGAGATSNITGSPVARGGGGGGSGNAAGIAPGGAGGGGAGATNGPAVNGVAGTVNTGGGGGAGVQYSNGVGANGGSGIVIIRYKFQ